MANARIGVQEGTPTRYLDTERVSVDAQDVDRERIQIVDGASADPVKVTVLSGRGTEPGGSDNPLFVAGYIKGGSDVQSLQKTVTTAGTAVALAGSNTILGVVVRALSGNLGKIYVGSSVVGSSNGYELEPGESIYIGVNDTDQVYIDSENNGEGVSALLIIP